LDINTDAELDDDGSDEGPIEVLQASLGEMTAKAEDVKLHAPILAERGKIRK